MLRLAVAAIALIFLAPALRAEGPSRVIISVKEQKLLLMSNGQRIATYPISTSKFGVGDAWGHMTTPLGFLQVAQKIGDHAPVGAVFRNRRFTGEILKPNAPGRDPVITRIIWLKGLQPENEHAFSRCIYIHGTPEERTIGRPASYGCIRMKSKDVAELYAQLPIGALVEIVNDRLPDVPKAPPGTIFALQSVKPEPKPEPEKVAAEVEHTEKDKHAEKDKPAEKSKHSDKEKPAEKEKAAEKEKPAETEKAEEKPAAKPAKTAKPKSVKKSLQEQPHFGRGG